MQIFVAMQLVAVLLAMYLITERRKGEKTNDGNKFHHILSQRAIITVSKFAEGKRYCIA